MVSGPSRFGSFAHAVPTVYTSRKYNPHAYAELMAPSPMEPSHNAKVFESIKQRQDQFMFQAQLQAHNLSTNPRRVAQFAGANASVIKAVQDAHKTKSLDSFTPSSPKREAASGKAGKAVASAMGWGIGAALATGILMALPVMVVGMVGFLPFMHWLWPVAGLMMHAPLAVGGLVGALRGFHVLNKK